MGSVSQMEEQFRLVQSERRRVRVRGGGKKTQARGGKLRGATSARIHADNDDGNNDVVTPSKDPAALALAAQPAAGSSDRQQQQLVPAVPPLSRRKPAGVDATFVKRMAFILRIVVPSITSKEAMLLAIQSLMLISRSFISLRIARKGGDGLQAVMERSWKKFFLVLGDFFVSGVAASVVNSALKYLTNSITVAFRQRLTTYVHLRYLADRAYYRAAVLRVGNLDNADQRIVEDLNQFCHTAADLFGRTFKPLLDVVLSTLRMGENMGYGGLSVLYAYFFLSGAVIRAASPPFSEYIARTQKLEGDFRRMHSRLITHAEEVAFLDGARRERAILDEKLESTTTWSQFYFYLQFKQGVIDQYFVKYFASMIGWPVLAFPFLLTDKPPAEIAARYRESDTLIQSASSSIGDLMMVYKKLQRLAGFTARVVELLEAVDTYHTESGDAGAGKSKGAPRAGAGKGIEEAADGDERGGVFAPPGTGPPAGSHPGGGGGGDGGVKSMVAAFESQQKQTFSWKPRGEKSPESPRSPASHAGTRTSGMKPARGGGIITGLAQDGVRFDGVTVYSPDGRLLVKDVTFALKPGENLFVTGANGAGKTSLFRVLAGLWAPSAGTVTRPDVVVPGRSNTSGGAGAAAPFQVFYVPQKPYLVSGSLRDQVMYPLKSGCASGAGAGDAAARDEEVLEALRRVNLLKLVEAQPQGLDHAPHDWADVLSGGEKQRVGLARLYFHKPAYAVLDEATSAINPDEEGAFYGHLGTLGITAFSIAHRMELKRFHHQHLHFHADGTGGWTMSRIKGTGK